MGGHKRVRGELYEVAIVIGRRRRGGGRRDADVAGVGGSTRIHGRVERGQQAEMGACWGGQCVCPPGGGSQPPTHKTQNQVTPLVCGVPGCAVCGVQLSRNTGSARRLASAGAGAGAGA